MNSLVGQTRKDIINWDVINWSKALDYWEKNIFLENRKYECLELGAGLGGLSLWLALNRNNVICSDINGPTQATRQIHAKYSCSTNIKYAAIDATNIPYQNHFDLITFKSILGEMQSDKHDCYKETAMNEIYKALKPGGMLLFAENLHGSFLHRAWRGKFGTKDWNYLRINEMPNILSKYKSVQYTSVGFLGCFGRSENQRNVLGMIDSLFDPILPDRYKYIVVGTAVK
jgi:SAM-dependent methyltransferase